MAWKGDLAKKIYRKAANRALGKAAELELTEANKTVPIEESILEKSGQTSQDESKLVAAISYDTKYARKQHEDTRLNHDSGRRAKWLEQTLKEDAQKFKKFIADEISRTVP